MKAKTTATRAKAAKPAPAKAKKATAKKAAATPRARPAGKSTVKAAESGRHSKRGSNSTGDLLRAGLNALSLPRAESAVADGLSKIADSFGLKKLEDVFDQRVASAMERIGYPSAKELQALSAQVAELVKLLKSQKTRG